MAIGVTLINLIDSLYINSHWSGSIPYDRTCSSLLFNEYKDVYYEAYFVSSCGMALLSVLTVIFVIFAGVNPATETGLIGFSCNTNSESNKSKQ